MRGSTHAGEVGEYLGLVGLYAGEVGLQYYITTSSPATPPCLKHRQHLYRCSHFLKLASDQGSV